MLKARWMGVVLALLASGPAGGQARAPSLRIDSAVASAAVQETRCDASSSALFPLAFLQEREPWYGQHFRAAGEASLCASAGGVEEVLRFTWLRTFSRPVFVRVERSAAGYTLTARRLSGHGGYEPGRLEYDRARTITPAQWSELAMLRDSALREGQPRSQIGLDGSQWIIEARSGDRYRAVDWWTPQATADGRHVHRLGTLILRLADLLPRGAELY